MPVIADWARGSIINGVVSAYSSLRIPNLNLTQNVTSQTTDFSYSGLNNFADGSLLQCIFLTAILIYMIDRKFLRALFWLLLADLLSFFGLIHGSKKWRWMAIHCLLCHDKNCFYSLRNRPTTRMDTSTRKMNRMISHPTNGQNGIDRKWPIKRLSSRLNSSQIQATFYSCFISTWSRTKASEGQFSFLFILYLGFFSFSHHEVFQHKTHGLLNACCNNVQEAVHVFRLPHHHLHLHPPSECVFDRLIHFT